MYIMIFFNVKIVFEVPKLKLHSPYEVTMFGTPSTVTMASPSGRSPKSFTPTSKPPKVGKV